MNPRGFARYGGIVMLVLGLLSLAMPGSAETLPLLKLNTSYGDFLGFLPMNIINKVALLVFGVAGIYVSRLPGNSLPRSILWSRVVFVVMGVAAILGIIPQTRTFFGYWPLFGGDALAHAVFAVMGGYFGFVLTSKVPADRMGPHPNRESLA